MSPQPTSLAELIATALRERGSPDKPWSYRKAATFLDDEGFPLSPETLRRLATGDIRQPGDTTIQALITLGLDPQELLPAIGIPIPETYEPFHLPLRANELTRAQRAAVLATIDAFLASNDAASTPAQPS